MANGILMNAKFGGYCRTCGGKIEAGTQIYFYPNDTKKAEHKACNSDAKKPVKKAPAKPAPRTNKLKQAQVTEAKAAPAPSFRKFTTIEIMRLIPAFKAFDAAVKEAGFEIDDMDDAKLAELFRVAKNATFSDKKEDYDF
jgi:hypothetical protein